MAPQSTHSFNSFSDNLSVSTRPNSESAVPELDTDVSTSDDVTSEYLSTRTRSVLGPVIDQDDGYSSIPYDNASIYAPSHFPTHSITYRSVDRWEDAETIDSTRSITELDVDYVVENGRRYCGSYYMPNDEDEQVRLQLLNQVYLKVFDGELTTVPLESPTQILDVGTGVGEWAIDMAERYPDCEVTGTDISNIFERRVPQNVYWEIDDAELEWERAPDFYDLVHLRDLTGAFSDWDAIYQSAFRCLKPGGWVEVLDFDDKKGLHDLFAYFDTDSRLYELARDLQEASILSGRSRGVGHLEPRLLVNAGYVDVNITEYSIPLKTQDGSTGKFWLLSCLNGMEPTCLRLLTKYKNWDAEEVRSICESVGSELVALAHDPQRAKTFVVKLRVLTGRKPGHHTRWLPTPAGELGSAVGFGEDGFQAQSEHARDPSELRRTSTTLINPDHPITGVDHTQAIMPTTHEMIQNASAADRDEHLGSTGRTTEDWLRNVDVDHSHQILHDDYTDARMMDEGEEMDTEETISTRRSHQHTTRDDRPLSASALIMAGVAESQNAQTHHLIHEHIASYADTASPKGEPEQPT
ncbi:putative methyltransferase domain-containing protein [Rosellinia necatrix]|uniref:Putative methyltransferase domain-containing protein n=1 Tax=Rosellinia necatrix TaxID=77044 RepID=A0A1W2TEH1_ROSNE|nr:putative methyltransferase domain-containing protein [Rosellinia necatrix]